METIKFTKRAIEALTFSGDAVYIADTETKGLMVRVGKTSKVFYLRRKVDGKTERIKVGPYPDTTVEQARRRAAELNAEIAKGRNPADIKRDARKETAFADFWNEYIDRYSRIHKRPASVREDEKIYSKHLCRFGSKKLSSITRADVQRMHHDIGKTAPTMANRAVAHLRAALNVARDWGYLLGANPCESIKLYRETARDRFIQQDELPRFWQALLDEPDRNIVDFVMIALLTGQRRSNVQAMRWDEVSFERAEWRIEDTKNHVPLVVPLLPEVVQLLRERQTFTTGRWVFPGTGRTGHLVEPKKAWRRVLDRAGISNLRIHDLRRTMGSAMAAAGVNTVTTARTLGHKTLSASLRYQQLGTDPRRAAIEAGGSAILANAGAKPTAEVITIKKKS